ncbi:MAG: hypothetical protein DRJ56_08595, partial [Thermoprotei archaeon]
MIKAVVISVIAVALLLIALAYMSVGGPVKPDLEELPVAWPPASELPTRWCSSGTRSSSVEAAIVSCEGECYILLRYWIFSPKDVEIRRKIPVEVRSDGEVVFRRDVSFYKGPKSLYISTPVMLVRVPEGAVVSVANNSVEIPRCSGHRPSPPQVIYTEKTSKGWMEPSEGLKCVRLMGSV